MSRNGKSAPWIAFLVSSWQSGTRTLLQKTPELIFIIRFNESNFGVILYSMTVRNSLGFDKERLFKEVIINFFETSSLGNIVLGISELIFAQSRRSGWCNIFINNGQFVTFPSLSIAVRQWTPALMMAEDVANLYLRNAECSAIYSPERIRH